MTTATQAAERLSAAMQTDQRFSSTEEYVEVIFDADPELSEALRLGLAWQNAEAALLALAESWEGDAEFLEDGDPVRNQKRLRVRARRATPRELAAEAARQCAAQLRDALTTALRSEKPPAKPEGNTTLDLYETEDD